MRVLLCCVVFASGLACSGLSSDAAEIARQAAEDAVDEAEVARLAGDFAAAEGILKQRLQADPNDARSWRLLGDVNLTRGQRFQQRWKENLGWAHDAYRSAVLLEPTNCVSWGRLAALVVASAENPATTIGRDRLDSLPLADGWAACPGPAMLEIELRRRPTDAELAAVSGKLSSEASENERFAAAAPWAVAAVGQVDLTGLKWEPGLARPTVAVGAPFVVLESTTAASVEGSEPRRFTYPEWLIPNRVAGDRIVYLDRRFPARVPEGAVTRAPGCPGTKWTLEGTNRVPTGQCVAGPQDRRASELYDPGVLRPAGVAHYHQPTIGLAEIPWETVADKSVTCLGGPVGRLFVDTPSCQVSYDRAVPQTRSLAVAAGLAAASEEHAIRMVEAARSVPLFGADVAGHLARGDVALGLPYGLYLWSQPEHTGCKGRGVYNKLRIVEGALEFDCTIGGLRHVFRELTLVEVAAAQDPVQTP